MIVAPSLGIFGPLLALLFTMVQRGGLAFIASALGILGIIATAGLSMFPFLMPSNIAPMVSLTVWDASSSQLTLFVMLLATLIFLPVVLVYTSIVFSALRGAVTASQVERNLRREQVVLYLDSGSRLRMCLRHPQCCMARASSAGRDDRRLELTFDGAVRAVAPGRNQRTGPIHMPSETGTTAC